MVHSSPGFERSKFAWPGTLCCFGQDTWLSQWLFPPRCINEYRRINLMLGGKHCKGLASHSREVQIPVQLVA